MTTTKATVSYNDQLWIGRYNDVTEVYDWTQIVGIEAVPFPSKVPEGIDATHQQSPGSSREEIPGLLPVGEASLEKQLWPADAGDILLDALAALSEAGTPEDVLIEFMIDHDTSIRRTYRGHIVSYTPSPTLGEKRMVTVDMKVFDRQASNIRVIA